MAAEQEVFSNKIKRIQSEEIRLIKVFTEICEKADIQYYMIGGTMLGAIRHKGFIPWDDDVGYDAARRL